MLGVLFQIFVVIKLDFSSYQIGLVFGLFKGCFVTMEREIMIENK